MGKSEKTALEIPHRVWKNPLHFVAFGFGTGLLPMMPGTFGSLIAIPFYLILRDLDWFSYVVVVAIITVFASWVSGKVSKDIGIHDHPGVNIDEIVGMLVTLFLAPEGWLWIALGFGFFRLFDIWKPGPIAWIDEHYETGFGMILDDIVAGIAAWICLQLTALMFGSSVFL